MTRVEKLKGKVQSLEARFEDLGGSLRELEKDKKAAEKAEECRGEVGRLAGKMTALESRRAEVQEELERARWLVAQVGQAKALATSEEELRKLEAEILRVPGELRQLEGERPPLALRAEAGEGKALAELERRVESVKARQGNLEAAARMLRWKIARSAEALVWPLLEQRIKAGEELAAAEAGLFDKIRRVEALEWNLAALAGELKVSYKSGRQVGDFMFERLATLLGKTGRINCWLPERSHTLAQEDAGNLGESLREFEERAAKGGPGPVPIDPMADATGAVTNMMAARLVR